MRKKHSSEISPRKGTQKAQIGRGQIWPAMRPEPPMDDEQRGLPPTSDAGGGVSEGTLRDASGVETGGGSDTPMHAEENTEATINRRKPLNQGTSAYPGGGADNGSNL